MKQKMLNLIKSLLFTSLWIIAMGVFAQTNI